MLPLKFKVATKGCAPFLTIRDAEFNNLVFILKWIFWISQMTIFPAAQQVSLYFLRLLCPLSTTPPNTIVLQDTCHFRISQSYQHSIGNVPDLCAALRDAEMIKAPVS